MSGATSIAQELMRGNCVTYFTVGESMKPLLKDRQTHVTIAPIGDAKSGDILLYIRKNGALVLHRLIKLDGDFYYMRGDNTYGLERIERAQAIGVATHVYRGKGEISLKDNFGYKVYAVLWRALYPCRFLLHKAAALLRRMK